MDTNTPSLSFIGITDSTKDAEWVYVSASVSDLLGYEPNELIGRSALNLVHPDELERATELYHGTVRENKAAVLTYVRLRHRDAHKGYLTSAVTFTNVGNNIIGGISAATPGVKAMHNASTAQEVIAITPWASQFSSGRWGDRTPSSSVPVSPIDPGTPPPPSASSSSTASSSPLSARHRSTFDTPPAPLPRPRLALQSIPSRPPSPSSMRTALILERFSLNCTILHMTNDEILSPGLAMGRSFFDFVGRFDEGRVRTIVETIKGWGVNERGQPSDGGFAWDKFKVVLGGRDSSIRQPDLLPSRHRHTPPGVVTTSSHPYRDRRPFSAHNPPSPTKPPEIGSSGRPRLQIRAASEKDIGASPSRDRDRVADEEEMAVEAILSPQSDGIIVILRPDTNLPPSSS